MAVYREYDVLPSTDVIRVDGFVSIRYFEFSRDFAFPEETHSCWELVYLDKGRLIVTLDDEEWCLSPGDMILYPPLGRHSILHNQHTAPNACGIAFTSTSAALYELAGCVQPLGEEAQRRMARLLAQADAFSADGLTQEAIRQMPPALTPRQQAVVQLLRLGLEEFFLRLLVGESPSLASCRPAPAKADRQKTTTENARADYMEGVIRYIDAHLQEPLTTEGLCRRFSIGKTVLCRDFKQVTGRTVKAYIAERRLETVKQMIRLEDRNFTEIADEAGFKTLHYFSAWFKKMTGLTPTEYATSIQAKYR